MTGSRTRVYIVEDNDALREDFAKVIESHPGLELLGMTGSAQQALRFLQSRPPLQVLLVDLGLPDGDGTDLIRELPRLAPQARALVISVFADDWRVLNALSAGAQGYLLKDTTDEDLARAITEVAAGDAPLSPQVARYLLRMFEPAMPRANAYAPAPPTPSHDDERLTLREAEVLGLVAQGHTAQEVATRLSLSPHTVNTHLRNCHAKLSARNRQQAILRARQSGQIG